MQTGWRQLIPGCSEQPNPSGWARLAQLSQLQAEQPRAVSGSGLPGPALPEPLAVVHPHVWAPGHSPASAAPARPLPDPKGHTSAPGHFSGWMERQFFPLQQSLSAGSCSRNTEISTFLPLTAFPSALTTDSRAGGTRRTPNSSGELGVHPSLIFSSSRCFFPKAEPVAVCPAGSAAAAGRSVGWRP